MKVMDRLKDSPIKTGASFMVTEESIDEMEDVIQIAIDKNLTNFFAVFIYFAGKGQAERKGNSQNEKKNSGLRHHNWQAPAGRTQ